MHPHTKIKGRLEEEYTKWPVNKPMNKIRVKLKMEIKDKIQELRKRPYRKSIMQGINIACKEIEPLIKENKPKKYKNETDTDTKIGNSQY